MPAIAPPAIRLVLIALLPMGFIFPSTPEMPLSNTLVSRPSFADRSATVRPIIYLPLFCPADRDGRHMICVKTAQRAGETPARYALGKTLVVGAATDTGAPGIVAQAVVK